MKIVLKSLFFGLTLAILSYSVVASDLIPVELEDAAARKCCKYQVDCPEDQECKIIVPDCSADLPNICKKKATATTADRTTP